VDQDPLCLGTISTELFQYKGSISVIIHVLASEASVTKEYGIKK